MRKLKVLFLCTQNSARSQMAEAFLRKHGGDRFEAYSAGCEVGDEIHPYATEVMEELGIDISDQYPKGLRAYMGKMGFNYSIIVCARAERNCPKTFPGVGTRLVWIFEDPRGEDVPEEERLEKFREVRDQIEQKILDWLEHPDEELAKLKKERELERQKRLEAARREANEQAQRMASLPKYHQKRHKLPAAYRATLMRN
jgi:arsenate reductase (thioredoxin)